MATSVDRPQDVPVRRFYGSPPVQLPQRYGYSWHPRQELVLGHIPCISKICPMLIFCGAAEPGTQSVFSRTNSSDRILFLTAQKILLPGNNLSYFVVFWHVMKVTARGLSCHRSTGSRPCTVP